MNKDIAKKIFWGVVTVLSFYIPLISSCQEQKHPTQPSEVGRSDAAMLKELQEAQNGMNRAIKDVTAQ